MASQTRMGRRTRPYARIAITCQPRRARTNVTGLQAVAPAHAGKARAYLSCGNSAASRAPADEADAISGPPVDRGPAGAAGGGKNLRLPAGRESFLIR
jgi:hypothetical protein